MKKILLFACLIVCTHAIGQKRFSRPVAICDFVGKSVSANIGFSLGSEDFVQTFVMLGTIYTAPNSSNMALSVAWKADSKRLSFVPMFTYAGTNYQDVSLRFGYYTNRSKKYNVNVIASTHRGYGIGITAFINNTK